MSDPNPVRVLGFAGSLRRASLNRALLRAAVELAPPGMTLITFDLADVPLYNGDVELGGDPPGVAAFKQAIREADAVLMVTPEYNHGVPGVMKNALDWLVPSVEFPGKPVALINASPQAHHAQAHLRETLTIMSAQLIEAASVSVPLQGRGLSVEAIVEDAQLAEALRGVLGELAAAARAAG